MKTIIAEILEEKGHDVWEISPDSVLYDAISLMADKGVGALVVKADEKLVGIISERDFARKVILKGLSSKEIKVEEVMSRDVISVGQDDTVKECMTLMTEKKVRHLPVLDGEELIGMVSIGDLVYAIIEEQEKNIGQLQTYPLSVLLIAVMVGVVVLLALITVWLAPP